MRFFVLPVGVVLFALLLHWVYANLVSPSFAYLGYRYREPSAETFGITIAFAVLVALVLPRRIERASSIVLWLLYALTLAPSILMSSYTPYLDDTAAILMSVVLALVFVAVTLGVRGEIRPYRISVSPTSFWLILAVFSLITYGLLAVTQGLSFRFISFFDVYDVREEYAANLEGVGILSYLVFTQANVVNPLMVARGVFGRRPLWTIAGLFGQFLLYSGTGFKAIILAIPAWLIMAFLLRRRVKSLEGTAILWGAAALVVVSGVIDELASSNILTSLLTRRFILTPGLFSSAYVGFFSENPQVHLGHSVLRFFVDYPYERTPPYVIGEWIANLPTMAANANLFADGYANFGWLGIIGAGAVLLVYLRVLNRAAFGLPIGVIGVVMTMPIIALSNTSVLTAMLSHGLAVAVLALAVMPRDLLTKPAPRPLSPRRYASTSAGRPPARR